MIVDIVSQLIWLDYAILVFLFIFFLNGVRKGLVNGIISVISVLCAAVFSLHYYPVIGNFLGEKLIFDSSLFDLTGYAVIIAVTLLFFWIIKLAFNMMLKVEAVQALAKSMAIISGAVYSVILVSLILVGLYLSSVSMLETAVVESKLSRAFIKVAPRIYKASWESILSKFAPDDNYNKESDDIIAITTEEE